MLQLTSDDLWLIQDALEQLDGHLHDSPPYTGLDKHERELLERIKAHHKAQQDLEEFDAAI